MTQFNLVYQTKTIKNKIVSIEALLRPLNGINTEKYVRNHPEPIKLDINVIKRVIEEIITFNIPVPVAINISYLSFVNDKFIQFCLDKIKDLNIILELTEYNSVDDIKTLQKNIIILQKNKIKISLDDFGKKFATTNLLTQIKFNQVKIDKSIIDDIEVNYAKYKHLSFLTEKIKSFGIQDIVYEGVEKKEQEHLINIFNTKPTIQGYLYSKPISIEMISFQKKMIYQSKKMMVSHHIEHIEKLVYDLVLSKNKDIINNAIRSKDIFKNIFNTDYKKTITNFNEIFHHEKNKLSINSIYHIMDNSERMIVIRNSQGIIIYENKKHSAFFNRSNVGIELNDMFNLFPDYKYCINDDNLLLNSQEHYSIKKELFNNISYFTIRQKVQFDNEFFILVTVYEENKGSFQNKDALTNCLLRDAIKQLNTSHTYDHKVIAFLDLNGFKNINDTYGHNIGDDVLKNFICFLNTQLRNVGIEDQVIRFGGDEFIILFNSINSSSIEHKLENINQKTKIFFERQNISLSFSYGLVKNSSCNIEHSIFLADKKMYLQKNAYKITTL